MKDRIGFIKDYIDYYKRGGYAKEEAQRLPSATVLDEVMSVLLNVSCMREEARFSSFRVCFLDLDTGFLDSYIYAHTMKFEKPLVFSASTLHKLVPAIHPTMSYLNLDIKSKPYMITGITASYTSWEKILKGETSVGSRMPDIPNFYVKGPGEIDGCFGEIPIVGYSFGKTVISRSDVFLSSLVADALRENSSVSDPERIHFLSRVLWHVSKYQHGGALLFVQRRADCSKYLDIKYKLPAKFLFREEKSMIEESPTVRAKELVAYADFIAKLTMVDGAVVLTKNLGLVGFGAEILTDKMPRREPPMCFLNSDDSEDFGKKFNDNGTRHRSGYRFCNTVAESVAIICSQDGTIKACTKHDGKVYVYNNILLTKV